MTDIEQVVNRFARSAGLNKADARAIVAGVKDAYEDKEES